MVLLSHSELRKFLSTFDENVELLLCEGLYFVTRGNVKVQIGKLEQHENVFKKCPSKKGFVGKERSDSTHKNRF